MQVAPMYVVVAAEGPDHDKRFEISLMLAGREYGRAIGRSKKEAEQTAAAMALAALEGGEEGNEPL
jgi:ribonuclease-3